MKSEIMPKLMLSAIAAFAVIGFLIVRSHAASVVTSSTGVAADGTQAGCVMSAFTAPASQWVNGMTSGCAVQSSQPSITDINGTTTITHIGKALNQSVNVGALTVAGKTVTVSGLTGVLAGDICTASPVQSQSVNVGLIYAGCQATATGTVVLSFSTAVVVGISLGTMQYNISWIG